SRNLKGSDKTETRIKNSSDSSNSSDKSDSSDDGEDKTTAAHDSDCVNCIGNGVIDKAESAAAEDSKKSDSRITSSGSKIADPPEDKGEQSKYVYVKDGRLFYVPDSNGNTIPDFSRAGYFGGGRKLPLVTGPVVTISPGSGDDGSRIQGAIDEVSKKPLNDQGIRGIVLLAKGLYKVQGTLKINSSGVILRGQGQQETGGSVILATGTSQRTLLSISGGSNCKEVSGTRRKLVGSYIPVGSKTVTVSDTKGLSEGDLVVIERPAPQNWIHDIAMDRIPGAATQWTEDDYTMSWERYIVKIEGDKITMDAPVLQAMEEQYGGGFIYRATASRISQIGIENIRFDSEFKSADDENHGWNAIGFGTVQDAWVRDVTCRHYGYACVSVGGSGKFITIQDTTSYDPVSQITGGRRYTFNITGQFILVQRTKAVNGRHDYVTARKTPGPNVFLDVVSEQAKSTNGPHHRWGIGGLFDNMVSDGGAEARDRGASGTGHGWAGAMQVFWNNKNELLYCQNPPTAMNWAIGCKGNKMDAKDREQCNWDLQDKTATPRSLYLRQLQDRLGYEAVLNIAK
ncbi:MAG: hypothetical protein HQK54_08875, partial [Oligoflexales bacterium]|nr:hypothetical protein [Oligoflexales bacterium]